MKKCGVVVFVLLFLLSGCKSGNNSAVLKLSGISFTAEISRGDEKYVIDCCINNNSDFTAKVILPEYLSGITYSCDSGNSVFSLENIEIIDADMMLPEGNLPVLIKEILQKSDGAVFNREKGKGTVKGAVGDTVYSISASPSGLPVSLTVEGMGATLIFKNVTCL